jgi:hypothetical protein
MPCCESILAVTASWFISVCGFCLCGIRSWKSHVWWFLVLKKILNLQQRWWVGRTGPNPWPVRTCFLRVRHRNTPFSILLMEKHSEIEHVLRPVLFWVCMQHKLVILSQHSRITNRSHFQGSRCPRRTCHDSRQPAHTWCLLEELIDTGLIRW